MRRLRRPDLVRLCLSIAVLWVGAVGCASEDPGRARPAVETAADPPVEIDDDPAMHAAGDALDPALPPVPDSGTDDAPAPPTPNGMPIVLQRPIDPPEDSVSSPLPIERAAARADRLLSDGVVRYDSLSRLELGQWMTFDVSVAETAAQIDDAGVFEPGDAVVEAEIAVHDIMEAELHAVSPGLRVEEKGRPRQWLDPDDPPHWTWRVTAIEPGLQQLRLDVYAVVDVDGVDVERRRTYRAEVDVAVPPTSWVRRAFDWVSTNSIASGTLMLLIAGAGGWIVRRVRKP